MADSRGFNVDELAMRSHDPKSRRDDQTMFVGVPRESTAEVEISAITLPLT